MRDWFSHRLVNASLLILKYKTMRKLSFTFIAFVAICMCSCHNNKVESVQGSDSDSVATDSVSELVIKADTIKTATVEYSDKRGCWDYKSKIEYPVDGPEQLVATVREWISETLRNVGFEEKKGTAYTGDMADGQTMCKHYAKDYLSRINMADYEDLPGDVRCALDEDIVKEFENDNLISFNCQQYWYGGGAHGGTTISGTTFRKSDGKRLDWNMIASKKALNPIIVSELKKCFEVKTDEELMECLMLYGDEFPEHPTVSDIPLPKTAPWISSEGLVMIYQQYEIAAYAAGMPTVTIPWNQLDKYIANDYKTLIKK